MKILVSGFNPFNNQKINPSLEVLNTLKNQYKDHEITKLHLDVLYHNDGDNLVNKIKEVNPDIVLLLGEAGGRKRVNLEYMAVNMESATIGDNKGELILHHEIIDNAPLAYKTNIDVEKVKEKINDDRFAISYHAGTFICNEIYYRALDYIYQNNLNIKCGFVHFPFLKEQTIDNLKNYPSLELNEMMDIFYKLIDALEEK